MYYNKFTRTIVVSYLDLILLGTILGHLTAVFYKKSSQNSTLQTTQPSVLETRKLRRLKKSIIKKSRKISSKEQKEFDTYVKSMTHARIINGALAIHRGGDLTSEISELESIAMKIRNLTQSLALFFYNRYHRPNASGFSRWLSRKAIKLLRVYLSKFKIQLQYIMITQLGKAASPPFILAIATVSASAGLGFSLTWYASGLAIPLSASLLFIGNSVRKQILTNMEFEAFQYATQMAIDSAYISHTNNTINTMQRLSTLKSRRALDMAKQVSLDKASNLFLQTFKSSQLSMKPTDWNELHSYLSLGDIKTQQEIRQFMMEKSRKKLQAYIRRYKSSQALKIHTIEGLAHNNTSHSVILQVNSLFK